MALTSGTVIDRILRTGDVGEPGYSAYGQSLRKCTYSGSKDDWHGATQGSLSELLPTCYITESVYSYLTKDESESVRSRIQGIVPNSYAHKVYGGIDSFNKSYYCWEFKSGIEARPMPLPDPCAGVTCEDICINADKYSQACAEEGADAGKCLFDQLLEANSPDCPGYVPPGPCAGVVCEPDCFGTSNLYETVCYEGECGLGVMIEENSPDCPGYTPPEPFVCNDGELRGGTVCSDGSIIYTEVCQSNKWVATGNVCSEEPEPEPDDDDKWIIYALIGAAVVLFYLLGWSS